MKKKTKNQKPEKPKPVKDSPPASNMDKIRRANYANLLKKVQAGKPLTSAELETMGEYEVSAEETAAPGKRVLGMARTMEHAAGVMGISKATLKAAKLAGAGTDIFYPDSRVNCDKLLAWLAKHPEVLESSGENISVAIEEALLMRSRRLAADHRLAEMTTAVIPVESVRATYTRSVLAAKSRWLAAETNVTMLATVDLKLSAEQAEALRCILARELQEGLSELSRCEWANG